jgi:transcriptional regulator with XRE-family HTH domain
METLFGSKLKDLREKHFPGESLRKVSDKLKLGDNFYSYLSKIELGVSLPSEDILQSINKTYELTQKEFQELLDSYMHDKVFLSWESLPTEPKAMPPAVREFLRTVKQNKDDESKTT